MTTALDYLNAIKKQVPNIQVDDGLMQELNRRAGQGSSVESVLNDAFFGGQPGGGIGYQQVRAAMQGPTVDPNQIQSNIKAATVAPITPQDQSGFQSQAAAVFDPQKSALSTDLNAKLKQTLAAGDESLRTDLSSRGFLRSGEQITRSDLSRTVAEADMALQEAGYLSDISTKETAYAGTLQANEVATRQANADAALKNQATSMGITQQAFDNMQTELGRIAQLKGTDFTQTNTVSQQQTALLANPDFATLLTGIGSQPQYQQLILQMLQGMGFNVTA